MVFVVEFGAMDYSGLIQRVKDSIAVVICINGQNQITSKGSGFVFSQPGVLVTCNHVVAQPDSAIKIRFDDTGQFLDAKVAIRDEEHDIAILKYDPLQASTSLPLAPVTLGDVKEGMGAVFAGYPLDLFNLTTHQGILSAIIKDPTGATIYMIDGTVNGGNSGCPMLSVDGNVIGVVNARRRENHDVISRIENMGDSGVSIYGIEIIQTLKAVISNLQMGMGYAIPCSYIPSYKAEGTRESSPQVLGVSKKSKK